MQFKEFFLLSSLSQRLLFMTSVQVQMKKNQQVLIRFETKKEYNVQSSRTLDFISTHRSSNFDNLCFNFACDDAYSPRSLASRMLSPSTVCSSLATPISSESCCCVAPKNKAQNKQEKQHLWVGKIDEIDASSSCGRAHKKLRLRAVARERIE